jgi:hypothetical protein
MANAFPGKTGFEPGVDEPTRRALFDLSRRIDTIEQSQSGISTVTTDADGAFTITFPAAFATGTLPVMSVQVEEDSATSGYYATLIGSGLSATAFSARIWRESGVRVVSVSLDVHWTAVVS